MARYNAICEYVADGDTFRTTKKKWIQLARYDAPEKSESGYDEAKQLLFSVILNKAIEYEPVSESNDRIIAEVWRDGKHVNDLMINSGYKKKK